MNSITVSGMNECVSERPAGRMNGTRSMCSAREGAQWPEPLGALPSGSGLLGLLCQDHLELSPRRDRAS